MSLLQTFARPPWSRATAGTCPRWRSTIRHGLLVGASVGLVACASGPAVPDWALQAQASLERATQAHLSGEQRLAQADHERARQQLARTGQVDLVARGELMHCAARLASLQGLATEPSADAAPGTAATTCAAFEPLRSGASPADRAYADFLARGIEPARVTLLPVAQQAAAAAGQDADRRLSAIRAIADPFSRLVAAAAALRDGVLPPGLATLAIDTASAQGWRRPLAAWLTLEIRRAQSAGQTAEAQALQQRLDLVLQSSQRSVGRQATP